ncbi:BQ5605_C007g04725 [Microbotryum silenes-dioicae]|uniref:BQ5605_C007g04725 protein n=1 Tax=Microbotryum silenes-dioicae TaxID=796604 RepID=A0A2X0MC82_9BASI|nr:BQ5605_C007g04725 [Microbotryum silenes-dioicae]
MSPLLTKRRLPPSLAVPLSASSRGSGEQQQQQQQQQLPSYTRTAATFDTHGGDTDRELPPPFSDFPESYLIKNDVIDRLVSPDSLASHLRVLGAFHKLRQVVEACDIGIVAPLVPEARYGVFVAIAVHRLELFVEKVLTHPDVGYGVPPLDVALVLHSYSLNPRCFQEDMYRLHPQLEKLEPAFWDRYARTIEDDSLTLNATSEEKEQWVTLTGTPFDPFEALYTAQGRYVRDPWKPEKPVFAPWVTDDGKGYAQQGFTIRGSRKEITHEVLGVARLAEDLAKIFSGDEGSYIASTVFSSAERGLHEPDLTRADRFVYLLRTRLLMRKVVPDPTPLGVGELFKHSFTTARATLRYHLTRMQPKGAKMITLAYARGENFSLDLTSAVLRQGTFVTKMHDLGWTQAAFPSSHEVVLQRCVARYHAFLDLMASSPSSFFVPTLDIDLAWHTHQLSPTHYRRDTISHVGRFIDHDDKVEENTLSNAFDLTANAWQARFGVPYSICGCPLPSEGTLQKLNTKLFGSTGKKRKGYTSTVILGLTSSTLDADATHPSEHNSIHIVGHHRAEKLRSKRKKELETRKERDTRRGTKGKMDPYVLERQRAHNAAYLAPVAFMPYYGFYGYPVGAGACAATTGGVILGGPGTAGGGTACAAGGGGIGAACAAGGGGIGAACGGGAGMGASCGGGTGACGGGGGGGGCGGGGGGGGCGGGGGGGGGG